MKPEDEIEIEVCTNCDGTGEIVWTMPHFEEGTVMTKMCGECRGRGGTEIVPKPPSPEMPVYCVPYDSDFLDRGSIYR